MQTLYAYGSQAEFGLSKGYDIRKFNKAMKTISFFEISTWLLCGEEVLSLDLCRMGWRKLKILIVRPSLIQEKSLSR